jgi:hypothetical protein
MRKAWQNPGTPYARIGIGSIPAFLPVLPGSQAAIGKLAATARTQNPSVARFDQRKGERSFQTRRWDQGAGERLRDHATRKFCDLNSQIKENDA